MRFGAEPGFCSRLRFFAAVIRKGMVNGYQVSSIKLVGMMSEWLLALLQSMV